MKTMKKTIILLALAAGAVLLLAGCDQILESMFQMNQNTVEIAAQIPIPYSQPSGWWDQKVWFRLFLNGSLVQGEQNSPMIGNSNGSYANAAVKFDGLGDGTLTILVWLDQNGDGQPTNGEWSANNFFDPNNELVKTNSIVVPYPNPNNKEGRYVFLRTDLDAMY